MSTGDMIDREVVSSDDLPRLLADIQIAVDHALGERDRFADIAATIRINALHRGASSAEADAMVSGNVNFIEWMAKVLEAHHPAAQDGESERLRAERDSLRAVLVGAEYPDVETTAKNTAEQSLLLGKLVASSTRKIAAERDALRADKAKLEALVETMAGVLNRISAPQYGLQGLMEDNAKEEDFTKYWCNMASGFASMARAAIAEYTRFKDGLE